MEKSILTYSIGNKRYPLYLKNWYSAGIKTVSDIWNFDSNSWASPEMLKNRISLFSELQYKRVLEAVNPFEQTMKSAKIGMIDKNPKIRTFNSFLTYGKITSKKIYQIFIQRKKTRPIHETYIQGWFNSPLEWKNIYLLPTEITRNAYILQTQFRLSHNILPTNDKLNIWKKLPRPHCICGIVDTNLHFIAQCKLIKPFWDRVLNFIKTIFEIDFPINDKEIYFGIFNPLDAITINAVNYVIINAKVFIWKEKRIGKPCHLTDFLPFLREQVLVEISTRISKVKPFLSYLLEQL